MRAIALIVLASLFGSAAPQESGRTVSGKVEDASTHQELDGVKVSAIGDQGTVPTTTDSDGNYVLHLASSVKAGQTVRIRFEKSGYQSQDKEHPISALSLNILMQRLDAHPGETNDTGSGDSQLKALTKLGELLNAPDETALRDKFGFSEMVYANIRITKSGLSFKRGYAEADRQWTTDYVHSHEVLWELGPTMKVEKDSEGRVQITGDGKTLSQVVLPHLYSDNVRVLKAYSSSSLMPNDVAEKVKELVHVIETNANLLISVLQEVYKTNPQLFFENDDPNSPNFHLIDNKYWFKFANINPFAEGISLEIRKIRESKEKVSKTNSGSGPPVENHQTSDTVTAIVRPPTVVDWHDKQNWRRYLRTGMTRTDVRQVFGEPTRMFVSGEIQTWDYGSGLNFGRITFFVQKETPDGGLYSWSEPH
jgi:hypothetical protein